MYTYGVRGTCTCVPLRICHSRYGMYTCVHMHMYICVHMTREDLYQQVCRLV